ncbi:phage minor head protein [Gordonia sp. LUNF6]|uniref:phage minor head protein n=1 Tax=Gordonia sp. LUNF6 TaxID=3388658 RepID=UPI00399A89DB
MAAEHRLVLAETSIEDAVVAAMRAWLDAARVLIIADAANQLGLTAAGRHRQPEPIGPDVPMATPGVNPEAAVQAATGAWNDWRRTIDNNVLPAVSIAFGDAFQQYRLEHRDTGSFTPQMQYMETVADRLRIWPEGAFEEIRPELVEALANAETIEQITDRVGMVLGIDKDQRAIKARINEIETILDDQDNGLDKDEIKSLRAERRALWEAHDEEETRWRWKARRIARTEAHGAVNAGALAAARQSQAATGDRYWKRWLATDDVRTRASHRVADGQTVPLDEKFRVGGFLLDFPGDPITIAPHETINCLTDPDTPIATDRGPKRVADIQIGDRVLTHRGRFRPVVRLAPSRTHSGDVVCLDVGDGVLRLTENHPVLTDQGWVIAGELSRGRIVLCASPIELGHGFEEPSLLGERRSSARTTSATDPDGPVRDECGMALLDDEVWEQCRAQLGRLRVGDLPAEHLGPAVLERLPIRVDDPDTGDLVEKPDDALVAVHRQNLRVVVEGPSGVLSLAARTTDGDRSLAVDESSDVGGSDGIEFHPTILPRTVVRYWVERADQVQLFNFAVDEDESYVANGIVVHNCRCTVLIYHDDALQDELQGPDGSMGEVRPEGVRIGPDDPDDVQAAVEKVVEDEHRAPPVAPDDRGEDHGQTPPAAPEPVELTDERETPVGPAPDLASFSDDELLDLMREKVRSDDGVYEAAMAEYDRRQDDRDD